MTPGPAALGPASLGPAPLDRRRHAVRDDLADATLRERVAAPRYAEGRRARIATGLAAVRRDPRADAPVETHYHYGEAVQVFDEADGFAWCQSLRDAYVGYIDAASLAEGDAPAPTHYVATLGSYRYAQADLRSPVIDFLPRHSPVVVAQTGFECRGTDYVWLDGGGFLPQACLSAAAPRSPDLAAAAALYLGCPYLWGGRSFLGFDCSGLVQEAFRDLGRAVPRDTDMQRDAIGRPVALTRHTELSPDDLIFPPGHVMIYAGRGRVIHASGHEMCVRHDGLLELLRRWGCGIADLPVRRLV